MVNFVKKAGTVFLLLFLINNLLWGQEADTTATILDPVVITGTRFLQQKSRIPASISVIPREAIELSNQTNILPLLATQVPGFFLNNRGMVGFGIGPNSGGNISIRGLSGSRNAQILVLIDGQPQFMGLFGHPITDAYMSSDIERVEVVRGAASLLYGSNAMGGAINIVTRSPSATGWNGNARLAYGSYQSATLTGSAGYKQGKFDAFASVNREMTGGFREEGRDDFENNTANLKLGYRLSEKISLSGNAQIADALYYHPGTVEEPLINDRREYLRGRASVSLENSFGNVEGALNLFYNTGDHEFADGFNSRDFNKGITFYQNFKLLPDNVITLGIDYKNFGGKALNENLPPPARVGFGRDLHIHETDFYTNIQHILWQKLSLHGGIRLVNNSQFGIFNVPGAGVAYQHTQNTIFKASVSKAFRSPAIVDLFLFPPANEELLPEEMWNYEIGFIQHLLEQKLNLELTGFIIKGDPNNTCGSNVATARTKYRQFY
jgi:iron complex outermembrane receptor protein